MNYTFLNKDEIKPYLKDIKNERSKPMTFYEEQDLLEKVQNGDEEAKEKLVLHNLRFVINVAKDYQNQGLEFSDLINEGNYGLIVAAEKYNPKEHTVKFISYAVWWVKQAIKSALTNNGRLVRVPANKVIEEQNFKKDNSELEDDEVAEQLGIPHFNCSINDEIDDNTEYGDMIPSEDYAPNKKDDDEKDLEIQKEINNCIDVLNYREKTIIKAHFGIGEEQKKLEKIAEIYFPDLSKERIRQHKMHAIRKLRDNAYDLLNFLE